MQNKIMYLINFSVQESIKIEVTGQTFDLHNHFDFQEYIYNVNKRELELKFVGIIGFDESEIKIDLKIIFRRVDFLRITEKDTHDYADEDSWQCLSKIGFLEEIFGSDTFPIELQSSKMNFFNGETCMVIGFMSGITFFIVSKTAEVELHQWVSVQQ
jgi:hypothetical protein